MKRHIDDEFQKDQNMNWDEAGNNWERFKGMVRSRWQQLSDTQVDAVEGRREKLLDALRETYGLDENAAEDEVRAFESGEDNIAAESGRGPTERSREYGSGNQPPRHHMK